MAVRIGNVTGIGWRADVALRGGNGEARVLAALSTSIYVEAGGEVLWVGSRDATPHARAIHVIQTPDGCEAGSRVSVALPTDVRPWRPDETPPTAGAAVALRRGATRLAAHAAALGTPRGFGAWLLGAPLTFPLDAARARADALASACAGDDPPRAAEAATALLGLGPGMTPAGDDFAGGAFFARALLARAGACDVARWRDAADTVRAAATRLTHPIGAVLLGDLLAGEGWAALHDLAAALARADEPAALDAARRLTRLGHSSGWDLLAGFVAGVRG
ncbi:MAG TPA: DUF2877 domain-containing protein [Patescibacteria group bacterium]|nr:DUF2877 domain-containing protein [Patescibacteria group bacterium]